MDVLQEIWEDYKKIILIVLGVIIAFIIGMIVFSAVKWYYYYNIIKGVY